MINLNRLIPFKYININQYFNYFQILLNLLQGYNSYFDSNKNFTDKGLTNLGKFIQSHSILKAISLNF